MAQIYSHNKFGIDTRMPILHLIYYIGIFFSLWTLYVFNILPFIKMKYPESYLLYNVFKLLIWTVPVFAYLRYENIDALTYLKLRRVTRVGVKWAALVSMFFIAYQFIGRIVISEPIKLDVFFDVDKWIKGVILVGFTEEILFRGFIQPRISSYIRFEIANIITAILFLLIHFPGWLALNTLPAGIFLKIALFSFIFIFSIVQGYVLNKTESLWVCIVIHSINNFMSYSLGD